MVGIARGVESATDDEWCALPDELVARVNEGRIRSVGDEQRFMRDIQAFHMGPERGWCDFAYTEAYFKSGHVYRGRGIWTVPAGQEGHNTNTWAFLCVLGTADTVVPDAMKKSLRERVRYLEREKAHRELRVRAHRSVNQTTCPGDPLARYVPTLDRV